jgi:hypothetical protein
MAAVACGTLTPWRQALLPPIVRRKALVAALLIVAAAECHCVGREIDFLVSELCRNGGPIRGVLAIVTTCRSHRSSHVITRAWHSSLLG